MEVTQEVTLPISIARLNFRRHMLSNMQRQQSEQNQSICENRFPNINYKKYGRFNTVMQLTLPWPKNITRPRLIPPTPVSAWPITFRSPLPFPWINHSAYPKSFRLPAPSASTPWALTQRRYLSRNVILSKNMHFLLLLNKLYNGTRRLVLVISILLNELFGFNGV